MLKATDIPFVNHIGIEQNSDELSLNFNDNVQNHIKTLHASAQFTLAETQSGLQLQKLFPELEGKVVPILRDAQIKYKKPTVEKIITYARTDKEAVEKFRVQFDKKGRGTLQVNVDVKDISDLLISQATFTWFVQKL